MSSVYRSRTLAGSVSEGTDEGQASNVASLETQRTTRRPGVFAGSPDQIRTGLSGLKDRALCRQSLTTLNANSRDIAVDQGICGDIGCG